MNPLPRTSSRKKQPAGPPRCRGDAVGQPAGGRSEHGPQAPGAPAAGRQARAVVAATARQIFRICTSCRRPAPLPARLALSRGVRVRGGGMRAPRACGRPTAPAWRARACSSPGGRRVPRAGIRGARGPTDLGAPAQINLVGLLGQGLAFMLRSPPPFSPRARARARACASPAPVGDAS